uniref:P/Homo B domain-containing protein n=1 Tax=Romanomermis culicivorax TaxID=13658 RepID=A0A915IFL9_ROMCU
MDAAAMVRLARKWTGSGEQKTCTLSSRKFLSIKEMSVVEEIMNVTESDHCWTGESSSKVFFLEHVQARVTLNMTGKRGDLQISLTSPAGTKSTLLSKRANDFERKGFLNWPFMSVHMWGEKIFGKWKLEIQNDARDGATLIRWDLVFHGTTQEIGPTGLISNSPSDVDQVLYSADQNLKCCGYSPLNICLACVPGHILFKGKCIDHCPAQYQIINESINSDCESTVHCTPCPGYCSFCTESCSSRLCISGFEYNENLMICEKSNLRNVKDPVRRLFNHYNLFKSNIKAKNNAQITVWNSFSVGVACILLFVVIASFAGLKFFRKNFASTRSAEQTPPTHTVRPDKKNRARILWQNWIVKKPLTAGAEFAMRTMPNPQQLHC